MPIKDGFTPTEQLKKDPDFSKIPVLMLAAFTKKGGESSIAASRGFTLET
ncbi:hypothetical protein ACFLT8_03835 [Chloroflexota bacterium]